MLTLSNYKRGADYTLKVWRQQESNLGHETAVLSTRPSYQWPICRHRVTFNERGICSVQAETIFGLFEKVRVKSF